jgi:aspartyl-tRNA(Asn)/glutamyl-tRNA(Gln) amidotransferase subunit A
MAVAPLGLIVSPLMSKEPAADHDGARELCEQALARTQASAARSTMIAVTAQRARREADRSDQRRRTGALRSPLDGVPIVWKDVFDVADTVTTCGSSSMSSDPPAAADGALVRRAHDLGLVTVGKTNLSEFAFSGLGINQHFGTPVNPLDPGRVPGGSSSGAAVAVAVGIAPLAVGTDTSGSVRVPAAFTGCVGFRASHNRYGRNDFRALSPTLDGVGVIARTVQDVRVFDRLLAGDADPMAATTVRAVIPEGEWIADCTPGVRASFTTAIDALRDNGVSISTVHLPSLQYAQRLIDTHGTIVGADAYAAYGHLLAEPDGIEPATRRRLARNAGSLESVAPVRTALPGLRRQFTTELAGAVLLCPTVRHEPPRIDELLASDELYDASNASTLRTTMVLSYLGTCGVTLPLSGSDGRSLSGLLVSAPAGRDDVVLSFAARLAEIGHPIGGAIRA